MAKSNEKNYTVSYREFRSILKKGIPQNMLVFLSEKILFDETIDFIADKFIGKEYDRKNNMRKFYSDDSDIREVINECSNLSFFSSKKIVIYKIIKRTGVRGIVKESKETLLNYIARPSPDTVLILHNTDKEFTFSNFEEFTGSKTGVYIVDASNEEDIINWVKEKFGGYKITDGTIKTMMQYMNLSYDEIYSEVEKLRTYCFQTKEITDEAVKQCAGFTKEFDEIQFIEALLKKDKEKALKIYDNLTLREDVDIYLIYLLSSAFIALNKMQDPKITQMQDGLALYRELRLWGDSQRLIGVYRKFQKEMNELKIGNAFDYIYSADKALKSTSVDKKAVISNLINKLTSL